LPPESKNLNLKPILAKGKEEEQKKAAYRITEDIAEKYAQKDWLHKRLKYSRLYCIW
jgi:hypothetical protein